MAESQERDAPRERDLPRPDDLPRIEDLPAIELPRVDVPRVDVPRVEYPSVGDDVRPAGSGEAEDAEAGETGEAVSLKDEIFAMASTVEVEDAARTEPLLRLWRGPAQAPSAQEIGRAAGGFLTFVFVDAVMMYAPLMMSRRPSLLPQMVALLVLAFGLGGLLVWKVRGAWRPFGIGMMLGWVFLTLVSLGLLTGVSP